MSDDQENNPQEIQQGGNFGMATPRFRPSISASPKLYKIGNRRVKLTEIREYSINTANVYTYKDSLFEYTHHPSIKENSVAENVRYLEIRIGAPSGRYYFIENVEIPEDYKCYIKTDDGRKNPAEVLDNFDRVIEELDKIFL